MWHDTLSKRAAIASIDVCSSHIGWHSAEPSTLVYIQPTGSIQQRWFIVKHVSCVTKSVWYK